ncbi:MAG: outer membrane lipoprotein-sorting protein [Limisphaerales bacterium]
MISRFLPVGLGLAAALGAAAATTNDLSDKEIQGRQLAQQLLLAQRPASNFTQTGILKIRDAKGGRTEIPIRFQIIVAEPDSLSWSSHYEMTTTNNPARLTIVHGDGKPNGYRLFKGGGQSDLDRNQTMIPFAGSDFWVADLGLEFFHWPAQKLLKKVVRSSRGCSVLESTNPAPTTNGYARVVSWIDSENGGILHAEAYDARGKLLKEYDTRKLKKMDGQWRVEEMEIENDQTGSRTRLEFDLKTE